MKDSRTRIIIAIALVVFGVVGRFIRIKYFPELYGVETLTTSCLFAGALLGGRYALIVPLVIIGVSDMIIGNTPIMFFTWTAWIAIGSLGMILHKKRSPDTTFALKLTGMGVVSTLFFYLWTNFGVWLIDGMYPHTGAGLVQSYVMGLPFLRNQIFGNLVIIPIAFLAGLLVWRGVLFYRKRKIVLVEKQPV